MAETTTTATTTGPATARFGWHALLYLVSNLLVRGLTIVLTPLYTRTMSPADFAVVAVANALTTALGILLGVAIYSCIPRLVHEHPPGPSRKRFLGTIFVFSSAFPCGVAAVLHAIGSAGALEVFQTVKFHPHLVLVIWTAAFSSVFNVPVSVYTALEEPRKVSLLNIASGAAQLAITIVLVAVFRQGAVGVLRAMLASSALLALVSVIVMWPLFTVSISWSELRSALAYSLPLVPHLLANWALAVSDRLVLEKTVSRADLGRYSLGYLLAIAVSVVAAAVTTPLTAAANRHLGDPEAAKRIPPLGTYALLITIVSALLSAVCAREIVALLAPPDYADAARVIPWVVAGAAFQGFYLVWSIGTWYSKKTGAVPFVTLTSVVLNIGINIALVPRFGVMVAAISTTISYATAALCHGLLAQRNHPIPWEYRRWLAMIGGAIVSYVAVASISLPSPILGILVKSFACAILFGATLLLVGFMRREELARSLRRILRRGR